MEDPASKRIKLDSCLICNSSSQFTNKREAYTELLINHLLPPSMRDKANNSKVFDFCVPCSDVLENLFQLKEGLEFILNSIKNTVESIKFTLLKNGCSGNSVVDNFRRIAVKDYCPRVRMYKNNSLMTKEKKTDQKSFDKDIDFDSDSMSYTYEEYDEPMSVGISRTGDISSGNKNSDNSSFSKASSILNVGDSSNSSTGSDSLPSKAVLPTELQKPSSNNLEDSIITVYEPPKFSSAQPQVYYENYKNMYKCKFCSTIIKGENVNASLGRHVNVIHAKNCRFKCGICYAIFFSKSKCRSHIGECHYEMFNMIPPKVDKEKEKVSEPVSKPIGLIPLSMSAHLRASASLESERTVPVKKSNKGVARKKTGAQKSQTSASQNPLPSASENQPSSSGKYSDDKIRSEVIINIEPKSRYNLIEDIVKFEPWDESSREFPSTSDPLSKSPEMIPTEESAEEETKDEREWSRPMLSYAQLAILAIKNIESNQKVSATLSEICTFICKHYPYFKMDTDFRRKIHQAMTSASRKYFKCVTQNNSILKQTPTKDSRIYTINNEALAGQHEIFHACFNESAYAMAFPERVAVMIENLWTKRIRPEEECVLNDSIDIVDGIGVKLDTGTEERVETKEKIEDGTESVDKKPHLRPTLSYSHLAYLAMSNKKQDLVKTENLNEFIKETFPFYKHYPNHGQWRGQISKALSTTNCFIKCGPGPYYWKFDEANVPAIREEFKNAFMKAILNFHFSLADPNKLEELIVNALGDDINMDFVKTCIKDFSNEENKGQDENNEMDAPDDQDNAMDVGCTQESESIAEKQDEEEDDDVVEIDPPDSDSQSVKKVQVKQDVDVEKEKKIQIDNVVGQYRRIVPVSVLPMTSPFSALRIARPLTAMRFAPMSAVPVPPGIMVTRPSAPAPQKESVIEIVNEEGSGYFYRLNDDSTFTFVTMNNDDNN